MNPEETPKPVATSWEQMSTEQLKLYAKEVADLYHKERQLCRELEVKNQELELRLKELSALNSMFQQHLNRRLRTEEAFKRLVGRLGSVAKEIDDLLRQIDHGHPRPP